MSYQHRSATTRLNLLYFETSDMAECIEFLQTQLKDHEISSIHVTGGGAFKYRHLFESHFGVPLIKHDEMTSLMRGANFLLKYVEDQAFEYANESTPPRRFVRSPLKFPYLLVSIGSGISILKMNHDASFERVDGSALGGGTFWGLGSLLTGCSSFDGLLDLAAQGHPEHVDMVVKDIYGPSTPQSLGLDGDLTASCFGKAARSDTSKQNADYAASMLQMISFNAAQIACLNARLHGVERIFFAGFFIRSQPRVMAMITQAVAYWGKGKLKALFLRHEGYLGAVGSFLLGSGMFEDEQQQQQQCSDTEQQKQSSQRSVAEQYITSFDA